MPHFSGLSSLLDCHLFWMITSPGLSFLLDYSLLDYHLCWIILCPHLHSNLDYYLIWIALSLLDYTHSWITLFSDYSSTGLPSILDFPLFCIAFSSRLFSLLDTFSCGLYSLLDYLVFRIDYPGLLSFLLYSFLGYPLRWITFFPGILSLLDYKLSCFILSTGLPFILVYLLS